MWLSFKNYVYFVHVFGIQSSSLQMPVSDQYRGENVIGTGIETSNRTQHGIGSPGTPMVKRGNPILGKPHVSIFYFANPTPPQNHGLIGTNRCREQVTWNTNTHQTKCLTHHMGPCQHSECVSTLTITFGLARSNPPNRSQIRKYAKNGEYTNHPKWFVVIGLYNMWRDTLMPGVEEPDKSLPYTLILAKIAKAKPWNQLYACVIRDA